MYLAYYTQWNQEKCPLNGGVRLLECPFQEVYCFNFCRQTPLPLKNGHVIPTNGFSQILRVAQNELSDPMCQTRCLLRFLT